MTSPAHLRAPRSRALGAAALLLLALAFVLRFQGLCDSGLSHWDEGTFAAGPLGLGPYGRGMPWITYAPPLVPGVLRALFALGGEHAPLALGFAAVCGGATVALVWFGGRRLVGEREALAAAAVLGGMEFHLAFSRLALTDVPFTLFFLLALVLLHEACTRGHRGLALLAGLAAGAAQWTKYHGFFVLLAAALALLLSRARGAAWRSWLAAALVAGLLTLLLAIALEEALGLAALRANNARWLVAPQPWVFSKTALFVARCLGHWVSAPVLALAALGCARWVRRRTPADCLWLAWTALFLAALPFYTNYPRLLVPLLVPLAFAAAAGLDWICARLSARSWALLALLLAAHGAFCARAALALRANGYRAAAVWLGRAARDTHPDLLVTQHALVFELGHTTQPGLTYDEPGAEPALEGRAFRYLVADLRLAHAPRFARWIEEHAGELELVATLENPLAAGVLVNSVGFEGLAARSTPEGHLALETIRIWRLRSR